MIEAVRLLTLLESNPQLVVLLFEPFSNGYNDVVFCPSHFVNTGLHVIIFVITK